MTYADCPGVVAIVGEIDWYGRQDFFTFVFQFLKPTYCNNKTIGIYKSEWIFH